jgi:predicted GNAT family acetyltransferase
VELDNPVWHALRGPQANLAEGGPLARRYQPDVAAFAALPDDPAPDAWEAMQELLGPRGVAFLARDDLTPPSGWTTAFSAPAVQMVAVAVRGVIADDAERLTPDDVPDMLAIVERTHPGPFASRTIELGEYVGLRGDDGALIAMAGERMFAPPYREVSAVCTDAAYRGRGLATRLVRHLVAHMHERGEIPMLHARADNVDAIHLYEALGFTVTREFAVTGYRVPS